MTSRDQARLAKLLQLHGYSACREALVLLEDHFAGSNKYESTEDFISKLNRVITFETDAGSSIIDTDLAYLAIQKLCNNNRRAQQQQVALTSDKTDNNKAVERPDNEDEDEQIQEEPLPVSVTVRVKNVEHSQTQQQDQKSLQSAAGERQASDFNIHYNFLFKRLNSLPVFKENFQLMKLDTLTRSSQPSIRCICFGLLVKDVSKIDGYMLIDSTGRVPVRLTPDTTFRNRLSYTNCIVLVEGVYLNPDDVLFAANVGLPPVLLDPIQDKMSICRDEKLVVILKELYMDDDDVCRAVDLLFTGYNSMEDPPTLFILIGDFTRYPYRPSEFRGFTKRLIRTIRVCDNLKECHFVFVPGDRDSCYLVDGEFTENKSMPKAPLTKEQLPINMLQLAGFNNIHLATNPAHVLIDERQISIVCHSYLKELKKHNIHDLSDHNEEFLEAAKHIILSNGHLTAGISKSYVSSMNLWRRPDLLVLADTEAFGNKYDYSSSKPKDTSCATVPSFSRQYSQFKVYYLKSGEIEDSQVSPDAIQEIEADHDDDDGVQIIEENRSELD